MFTELKNIIQKLCSVEKILKKLFTTRDKIAETPKCFLDDFGIIDLTQFVFKDIKQVIFEQVATNLLIV